MLPNGISVKPRIIVRFFFVVDVFLKFNDIVEFGQQPLKWS